jgi:hypothetical protein
LKHSSNYTDFNYEHSPSCELLAVRPREAERNGNRILHGEGVSDDEAAASKPSEEFQKLFEEGEGGL